MSGQMYQGDYDYNDFLDVFLAEGGDPNHLHVYFERPVDVALAAQCRAAGVRVWVAHSTPVAPSWHPGSLERDRPCPES
jgi:hypothetical protein